MKFNFKPSPNYRDAQSTTSIMMELTIGLLVVFAAGCVINLSLNGATALVRCLLVLLVAVGASVGTEAVYCLVLKKTVSEFISSSFPWVTGIIIALTVRPNVSLYAIAIASIMAIFFGKLVFGGFGQNVFNPAAVGRAIILSSFTTATVADVVSGATPLSTISGYGWLLNSAESASTFLSDFGGLVGLFLGTYQGAIGETCSVLIIIVGAVLAYRHVIDWKVPAIYVGTVFVSSLIVGLMNGQGLWYPLFAVLSGAVLFGGVFMLTDPVTNPTSSTGRVIFAMGAGLLTVLIRVKANTPGGVVYSILIMNMLTPLIEQWVDGNQIKDIKKMKKAAAIVAGVVAVVSVIVGLAVSPSSMNYKSVVKKAPTASASGYADGTYTGSAMGMAELNVTVTVSGGKITAIDVDQNETPSIGGTIYPDVVAAIIEAQSTNVESVSGATVTSDAVKSAVDEALAAASTGAATSALKDGTYTGSAMGMAELKVTVTVEGGKITTIDVDQNETPSIGGTIYPDVVAAIIEAQSTDVESVSGATVTSDAVKSAVDEALASAK